MVREVFLGSDPGGRHACDGRQSAHRGLVGRDKAKSFSRGRLHLGRQRPIIGLAGKGLTRPDFLGEAIFASRVGVIRSL